MSKTFRYFKKTGELRDRLGEWDGDKGYWFEYEVDEENLQEAIVDLLFDVYFDKETTDTFSVSQKVAIKEALKNLTDDNGNWEELYNDFEDDLKSMFEEEALDSLD